MINQQRVGFTLIELMMVLSIIAGVVGLVSWGVHTVILEHRLEGAFDDIAIEIKGAQAQAVLAGEEILMRYDLEKNRFSVEHPHDNDIQDYLDQNRESRRRLYGQESGEVIREFDLDDTINLRSVYLDGEIHDTGSVLVFFSPDGTAEPHRLLVEIASVKSSVALEVRGLVGEVREIDSARFEVDWDEEDGVVAPYVIEDEDFFNQGYPQKTPEPSEGSENSDS